MNRMRRLSNSALLFFAFGSLVLPACGADKSTPPAATPGPTPAQDPYSQHVYRSPGRKHKVRALGRDAWREIEAMGGKLVQDYGNQAHLYEIEVLPDSKMTSRRDAYWRPEIEVVDFTNLVMYGPVLDVSLPEVQAMRRPVGDFKGKRIWIVHFVGGSDSNDEEEELRKKTGLQDLEGTYYGDADSIRRLQKLAKERTYIDWEGEFQPEWKIDPDLKKLIDTRPGGELIPVDVQLVDDPDANPATEALIEKLSGSPPISRYPSGPFRNVKTTLKLADLATVAALPDVCYVGRRYTPKLAVKVSCSGTPRRE